MSVEQMVGWLDREETAAARERRYRRTLHRLPPDLRRFVRVLRHVLEDVPGPEGRHREKIMKALKIGLRMHQKRLAAVRANLPAGPYVEGPRMKTLRQ